VGTDGVDVDGVDAGAGGHEEAIAFAASEADIGADFGEVDLADTVSVGGEDVNTVITVADPTGTGPDIAVGVATDAVSISRVVKSVEFHGGKFFAVLDFALIQNVPDFDVFSISCIGHVELFVVLGEAEAVGLVDFVGQLGDFATLGINAVNGFLVVERAFVAFVVPHASVAWIGKPDGSVFRMDNDIIGGVEGFAFPFAGKDRGSAVIFVANDATVAVFAGDLAALEVEGVAVAVAGWMSEEGGAAIIFDPPKLDIVGNVGEK